MDKSKIEKALAKIEHAKFERFEQSVRSGMQAVSKAFEENDPLSGLSNLISLGSALQDERFSDLDRDLFDSSVENIALSISENCQIILEHLSLRLEEQDGSK